MKCEVTLIDGVSGRPMSRTTVYGDSRMSLQGHAANLMLSCPIGHDGMTADLLVEGSLIATLRLKLDDEGGFISLVALPTQ